ncbi:MAG: hypothetical protein H0T72_12780 [Chloroflexia bacterium]|jgi:hypothetical protein|nr:hypothetical protein [Chloroflexia bacterium]
MVAVLAMSMPIPNLCVEARTIPFLVAIVIGVMLIALSIWGINRGFRFWGFVGIIVAVSVIMFSFWGGNLESDEGGDMPIPVELTPTDDATPTVQ